MTDSLELQRWRDGGKAPAGSCPFCASRISMIERDGRFRARCSHRGCGATGPLMTSITRAADVFCCPPHRTAGGMSARTLAAEADAARWRKVAPLIDRLRDARTFAGRLRPCPFCGDEAEFEREGTRRQSCIVSCTNCGGSHECGDEGDRSGSHWNSRAGDEMTDAILAATQEPTP